MEKRQQPYRQGKSAYLPNSVAQATDLSAKAKGILLTMMSFPHGWHYRVTHLRTLFSDGRRSFDSGLKELVEKGYVARHRIREDDGKIGYDWIVSDTRLDFNEHDNFLRRDEIG